MTGLARERADGDIADMSEETIQTLSGAALAGLTCACPTLGLLRAMKGLLIALQFHHKAAEGRLTGREP
jgi:uncharacterized protein (DUF983 family)